MRLARRAFSVGALAALVVAVAPVSGAQTPTVTSVIGSADGLFVEIDVEEIAPDEVGAAQVFTFGPAPTVALPPEGGSVSDELVAVDEDLAFFSLTADSIATSAEGAVGPEGFATAETTIADILFTVVDSITPVALQAQAISVSCTADLDGVAGSTSLVGATVLGEDVSGDPSPNTEIPIPLGMIGTANLVLNQQVENADGSLSVTGLALEIEVFEIYTASVAIGPATCGVVEGLEIPQAPLVPTPVEVTPRFTG
jgi:hypothetical protein